MNTEDIRKKYTSGPAQVCLTKEALNTLTEHAEEQGGEIKSASSAINELIVANGGKGHLLKLERMHDDDLAKIQRALTALMEKMEVLERPFAESYLHASDHDKLSRAEKEARDFIVNIRGQIEGTLNQVLIERLILAKLKTIDLKEMSEAMTTFRALVKRIRIPEDSHDSIKKIIRFFNSIGLSEVDIQNRSRLAKQDFENPRILEYK